MVLRISSALQDDSIVHHLELRSCFIQSIFRRYLEFPLVLFKNSRGSPLCASASREREGSCVAAPTCLKGDARENIKQVGRVSGTLQKLKTRRTRSSLSRSMLTSNTRRYIFG